MKVSIIIPVYNVSDYIIRCLNSVINQTYTNIECILVDDNCPDNSIELAKERLRNYDGLIEFNFFYHAQNKGVAEARNTGIRNAKGDYLYFLDSDDEIVHNCIELLVDLCQNREEMVIGNFKVINGTMGNHIKCDKKLYTNKDIFESYINKEWFEMPWNKLIDRNFIMTNDLFFSDLTSREDALWSFRLASKLRSMSFSSQETYIYYIRDNSLYTTYNLKTADDIVLLLTGVVNTSLKLPYNTSDYIVNLGMGSIDEIYYKVLTPLSLINLFKDYTKKIKTIVNKYPICDLNGENLNRLSLINHPLLLSIFYQYQHHKVVAIIYHRIILKLLKKK